MPTEPYGNGSSTSLEVALVKAEISGLKGDIATLAAAVGKLTEQGQWSVQKIGPLASVGGIVGFILVLFINNQTAPLTAQMKSMDTALAAISSQMAAAATWREDVNKALAQNTGDDKSSQQDRADIKVQMTNNSERISALEAKSSAQSETNRETETQLRGIEQISNIRWNDVHRLIAMLWKWVTGQDFPQSNDFYPGLAAYPPAATGK